MLPIIYGLASALSWGAGDFTGGVAARKVGAYRSVFYGEVVGLIVIIVLVFISNEPIPSQAVFLTSMLAGAVGTIGLLLLYHSMTLGLMSITGPVSALLAAMLPVVVGIFSEGLPDFFTLIGFGFAFIAVWMISQGEGGIADIFTHLSDLKLPLLAGIGFGLYFVIMHQATSSGALLVPMLASRIGGLLLLVVYLLFARVDLKITDTSAWGIICINGVLDLAGNGFFILAGQAGRLDVAAVLSALFPSATVMLAWIFLKERLTRTQWLGVLAALIAIVLMTI